MGIVVICLQLLLENVFLFICYVTELSLCRQSVHDKCQPSTTRDKYVLSQNISRYETRVNNTWQKPALIPPNQTHPTAGKRQETDLGSSQLSSNSWLNKDGFGWVWTMYTNLHQETPMLQWHSPLGFVYTQNKRQFWDSKFSRSKAAQGCCPWL